MSVLIDANILLYAKFLDFPQHQQAKNWLDNALNQPDPLGIPWQTVMAFIRISTNRRIFEQPLSTVDALEQTKEWTQRSNVWMPEPGDRFEAIFSDLAGEIQATGNLISDTYLAALAREHGLTVVSSDADFARFSSIKWLNPLNP